MSLNPHPRGIRLDLGVTFQKIRLPHQGDQGQNRADAHRLQHGAHHHGRDNDGAAPQL